MRVVINGKSKYILVKAWPIDQCRCLRPELDTLTRSRLFHLYQYKEMRLFASDHILQLHFYSQVVRFMAGVLHAVCGRVIIILIRNIGMELPVKIQSLLKADSQGFLCCSGKDYVTLLRPHQQKQAYKMYESIIDTLGALSAKAQSLKQVITSSIKFTGTDHRIYIKIKDNKALGFIKVGEKNLFYRDFIGNIKELKPTCILDFYVHESCQRSGIGKEIFVKFLAVEQKTPQKLAYDRPSEKLLSFLKKHYGLIKFIPQNNNYVIYDRFFLKQQPVTVAKQQTKPQVSQHPLSSSSKTRPKSYLPSTKVEQSERPKEQERGQTRRQFQQFQTNYHQTMLSSKTKHKNTTSEGNPFSIPLNENPAFRTTSNTYGNYYHKKQ